MNTKGGLHFNQDYCNSKDTSKSHLNEVTTLCISNASLKRLPEKSINMYFMIIYSGFHKWNTEELSTQGTQIYNGFVHLPSYLEILNLNSCIQNNLTALVAIETVSTIT